MLCPSARARSCGSPVIFGTELAEAVLLLSEDKILQNQFDLRTPQSFVIRRDGAARDPQVFLRPGVGFFHDLSSRLAFQSRQVQFFKAFSISAITTRDIFCWHWRID